MEPIDRVERVTEIAFVSALVRLMTASGHYSDVDPQALRSTRAAARVVPDITAYRDGRQVVIEAKGAAPAVKGRIDRYLRQLQYLRESYPDAQLILAIPEELQEAYSAVFRAANIEVWDPKRIAQEFSAVLEVITDPYFKGLFTSILSDTPLERDADRLRTRLLSLQCGQSGWSLYQKYCVDLLEYLFVPPLGKPIYELADDARVNRRDIILPNYSETGFWHYLRNRFVADYIVIDAKNYCELVKKREVLQVANYLKQHGAGMFAIILTRKGESPSAKLVRREQWTLYNKLILFLNDADVGQMLTLKASGTEPELVLRQKIEEFRLKI